MMILLYREHVFALRGQSEMKNDDSSIQRSTLNCDSKSFGVMSGAQNFGKTGFLKSESLTLR